MKKLDLLFPVVLFSVQSVFGQRIDKETISFQLLKEPVFTTDLANRNYTITVKSPYNITKDDVLRMSKEEHQNQVNNYQTNVETAKIEHQERLKDYEAEVKKLQEKFKLESAEYNKLSAVEKNCRCKRSANFKTAFKTCPQYSADAGLQTARP